MDHATTPESVGVQRYVGTSTSSPLRQSPNREEIDEAGVEDFQSQSYRPFTQDAALLHVNYHDDAASSTPERHENSGVVATQSSDLQPIVPLLQIDPDRVELIKDTIKDVYGFDHPRPFQIEAVHHLAFEEWISPSRSRLLS